MTRFFGELHVETTGYGFLKNVRTTSGTGKHPDVFVRVSLAKKTLGRDKNLLSKFDGTTFVFSVKPSERFPEKVEAYNVRNILNLKHMLPG